MWCSRNKRHTFLEGSWVHMCLLNTSCDSVYMQLSCVALVFPQEQHWNTLHCGLDLLPFCVWEGVSIGPKREAFRDSVHLPAPDSLWKRFWWFYKRHQSAINHSFSSKIRMEMMQEGSLCNFLDKNAAYKIQLKPWILYSTFFFHLYNHISVMNGLCYSSEINSDCALNKPNFEVECYFGKIATITGLLYIHL